MTTYELRVHARDVNFLGQAVGKHTGYYLIKYVDGVPVTIESVELYGDI